MKKTAVFFPGIGYTVDKPLMHYSRRLAAGMGYEILLLPYTGFPKKILGDREKMAESYRIALAQAEQMLSGTDLTDADEILFVGKSVGTIVAAQIASVSPASGRIRFVLYTPLAETFSFPLGDAIVFTGSADPWVGGESSPVPDLCRQKGIPCHLVPGANHSLEGGDIDTDLIHLQQIMKETASFIGGCS